MQVLLYLVLVLAGVANGAQAGMNAQLGRSLGQPIAGAFVVYTVGMLAMLAVSPAFGFKPSAYLKLGQAPWWSFLGGLGGAAFILAMVYATDKVGSGVFMGLTVTAALLTSVAADHFGWLGLKQHVAGVWRIVGVALLLAGVGLIARF